MSAVSIRNLESLPQIDALKRLLQALATLDAIMSPNDFSSRYYSFNGSWSPNEKVCFMKNGMGDEFVAFFNDFGCLIKGFYHESPMSPHRIHPPQIWSGMYENVPKEFMEPLKEPAFAVEDVTFCVWRRYSDTQWSHSPIEKFDDEYDPEGSEFLLELLDGSPSNYVLFAAEYYELDIPLEAVCHVYDHRPLTNKVLQSMNPNMVLEDIQESVGEIGYPCRPV